MRNCAGNAFMIYSISISPDREMAGTLGRDPKLSVRMSRATRKSENHQEHLSAVEGGKERDVFVETAEGSIHLPRCTCKRRKPIYQTDLASPFRKVWRVSSAELRGTFSIHFSSREKVGEERISKERIPRS